jgi:hypothetical protein
VIYEIVPPRWVFVVLVLVLLAAGALAGEGCKYVARHARIGWQP